MCLLLAQPSAQRKALIPAYLHEDGQKLSVPSEVRVGDDNVEGPRDAVDDVDVRDLRDAPPGHL